MNHIPKVFPDGYLKALPPDERAKLGKAGLTSEEAQESYTAKSEKEEHSQFEAWMNLHKDELYWDHSATRKGTTNRPGHPDFVVQHKGKCLNIEMKIKGGKLRPQQEVVHAWIRKTGGEVHVCYSAGEAIAVVRKEFSI